MKRVFILGLTLLAGNIFAQTVTPPKHGQLYYGTCTPAFAADACDSVGVEVVPGTENVVEILFIKDHRIIVGLQGTIPTFQGEWIVTDQIQFQEGPADQFSAIVNTGLLWNDYKVWSEHGVSHFDWAGEAKPVINSASGVCTLTYERLGGWNQEGPLIAVECGGMAIHVGSNFYADLGVWTDLKPHPLILSDKTRKAATGKKATSPPQATNR